jgi:hypothetical protein
MPRPAVPLPRCLRLPDDVFNSMMQLDAELISTKGGGVDFTRISMDTGSAAFKVLSDWHKQDILVSVA